MSPAYRGKKSLDTLSQAWPVAWVLWDETGEQLLLKDSQLAWPELGRCSLPRRFSLWGGGSLPILLLARGLRVSFAVIRALDTVLLLCTWQADPHRGSDEGSSAEA
jgi:hypothetical protein